MPSRFTLFSAGAHFPLPAAGVYPWRLLAVFLLIAVSIGLVGWWAYNTEAEQLRQRQYEQLRAIADFKADQIEAWLIERRRDAKSVVAGRFIRSDFNRWLDTHDIATGERLTERLEALQVYDSYVGIELLDQTGTPRLVVGSVHHDPAEASPAALAAISHAIEPQLVDLHRDQDGSIRLAYLLPIPLEGEEDSPPLGYLRLTIDPERHLYPLIQSWPTPSPSAETLIVRREGDQVAYLNDLRHAPNTALGLRTPLTGGDRPAAEAAAGREGLFEGLDYRGVEVLSHLRPIPGTPWHMVAKVDRAEVFRGVRKIAQGTVVAIVILMLLSSLILWMWWRRQQLAVQLHFRQELERIAEVSPGVIHSFCLRPDGTRFFPYASPAIRDVYGFAPEQLAKDAGPALARIHPDDARWLQAAWEASARNLSGWQAEYRYGHPAKGEIWVEGKAVPTRQPDGSIVWYGSLSDVTERKQAEKALRESELRFSTVFRESPLGISISTITEGLFLEVNDAFLHIFGRSREETIGHTSTELQVWGDPEDRPRLLGKLQEEGTLRNIEAKFRCQSGELLDILYSAGIIELAGKYYLLSLFANITSLRQAEQELAASRERYRSLYEHMLEGYALCRMRYEGDKPVDFLYVDVNPAFERLSGLENPVGKWGTEVVPDLLDSTPELVEACGRVARNGQSERLEVYVKDLRRWFAVSIFSSEPEFFVVVFDNITERKETELAQAAHRDRLESEVAARTAELVAVNKELQAFTYAASHDLKAPLRGISGFASLLEREYRDRLEGDGLRFLDHILASTAKMTHLIDDLLAYARLEQQTQHLKAVDLPAALREVLAERQEEIRQRGTEVQVDLPAGKVRADPHGLAQVLRNLIENALKYSAKAEHPIVRIGGEWRPEGYRLWVRDNGVGFDMAFHDKMFEIFRRLHSSQEFSGSGVGLALVKKAMERMGGRVWAESEPGRGATFFLEFQRPA